MDSEAVTNDVARIEPDLSVFIEANRGDKNGKKMPWDERVALIERTYPSVLKLDWKRAFDRDLDMFAKIMQDILKADAAAPGRSGPKPGVDMKTGAARLRQLMRDDYSMIPFHEAFTILAADRSLSALAAKTKLSRSQIRRLLRGDVTPSAFEMECVAKAFSKSPGYFAEYRAGTILAALADRLENVPEASVKYWHELAGKAA